MTKNREALISAVDGGDSRREYTITEIAKIIGDDKNRVKPVFDKFRSLFAQTNQANRTQVRKFSFKSVKAFALYQILCNELNFRSYKADEILQSIDNDVLWDYYKRGLGNLSAFVIENSNGQPGAAQ